MINDIKPIILLSRHFRQENDVLYEDQCDCACPDNGLSLSTPAVSAEAPLRCADLHIQPLPQHHTLMFNPRHEGGVAVLNAPARRIWERFETPQSARGNHSRELAPEMVAAGLLEPVGEKTLPVKNAPRTLSVWMHVTNECNLRCRYCYINKTDEIMSLEIGRAAIDAIMRSAMKNSIRSIKLKFAGGEPTLNLKLVFDLYAYAQEQAAQAEIALSAVLLSNGIALGERAIQQLKARGIHIMISLDGVGAMHDRQRPFVNGRGSFAWVERTLDRLASQGVKPFISITVSDRNVTGLPQTVGYVLDRGLPFNLNFYRDHGCATPRDDLRLRNDRLIEALRQTFAVIESRLPAHSLLGSLMDRAQFDQAHDKTCGVGDAYLIVNHHGQIAKCQMEAERPVTDVYADDPLALIRADQIGVQNLSVEEKEGCHDCTWKYWCAGGCPVQTFRATGRYDVKSPYCNIYKAVYPAVLHLEGLRLLKLSGILN